MFSFKIILAVVAAVLVQGVIARPIVQTQGIPEAALPSVIPRTIDNVLEVLQMWKQQGKLPKGLVGRQFSEYLDGADNDSDGVHFSLDWRETDEREVRRTGDDPKNHQISVEKVKEFIGKLSNASDGKGYSKTGK